MAYTNDKKFNFEYPELTKIHGEPDHLTILNMTKELKANAQSQRSDIGGGNYKYLPLIIPEVDFLTLPNTTAPVTIPVSPPPFTVDTGTTAVQSMVVKSQWETETRAYLDYVQMQLAPKNQISQAIDVWYLKALRNPVTSSITRSVRDILTFLKSRFGRVNITQFSEAETALKTYIYDLTDPIDEAVFQRIDDYAEITDMATAPVSERQKIDLAMLILIKSRRFQLDIRIWNATDPVHKTWDNFKDDFRAAYDTLRELGDFTVDQSPVLNQAQLMESIMNAMQIAATGVYNSEYGDPSPPPEQQARDEHANNTFENTLLRKFEELTSKLAALKQDVSNRTSRSTHGRTPKRYCWTHGCCPHWGKDCTEKKEGHKNDANFRSRKGGSDKNRRPNA